MRRYEQGESEAGGIGSSALDALTGRKSEIVDIFLWGNALLAPDAGRTCQKSRQKSRDFATARRRRYSHAGTRHGSPSMAPQTGFRVKTLILDGRRPKRVQFKPKAPSCPPKPGNAVLDKGPYFRSMRRFTGLLIGSAPQNNQNQGTFPGLIAGFSRPSKRPSKRPSTGSSNGSRDGLSQQSG